MPLRVTIDARWLHSGLGAYTRQLLAALAARRTEVAVRAITRPEHAAEVSSWCSEVALVDIPIYTLREQLEIPWKTRGCDLVHAPHYNAPVMSPAPLVVTLHDIMHLSYPEYSRSWKSWVYSRPMLRLIASRATQIITISDYSRRQILDFLDVDEEKITVIYRWVGEEFTPGNREQAAAEVSRGLALDVPYFLYVGNLKPHKNIPTLLNAFSCLSERLEPAHTLLLLGDDARGKPVMERECERLGIKDRVRIVPHAPSGLFPNIYRAASALILPSRIEGFGLPVLEAMACGTPVLCSNAGSLPEVAGDAALYFDPDDPEELMLCLQRIAESTELRQSMRERGFRQSQRFSGQEAIRKHLEVYRRALTC